MKTPHVPPATPGWEVFRAALVIVLAKPSFAANLQASTNLAVRRNELIPADHLEEICNLVLQFGVKSADNENGYKLPTPVVEFLHCQIGRDAFSEMLAKSNLTTGRWVVVEIVDDTNGIGYNIFTTDLARLARGVRNEGFSIISRSPFGTKGVVQVNMQEFLDRLFSREPASEEPATPAAKTAEPG